MHNKEFLKKKSISETCLASRDFQQIKASSIHPSLRRNKSEESVSKGAIRNFISNFKNKSKLKKSTFKSDLNSNSDDKVHVSIIHNSNKIEDIQTDLTSSLFDMDANRYYNAQYAIEVDKVKENFEIVSKIMMENIQKTLDQQVNLEELEIKAENLNREALNLQLTSQMTKRKFYKRHRKFLSFLILFTFFLVISLLTIICVKQAQKTKTAV